jgi:hypothetical protein
LLYAGSDVKAIAELLEIAPTTVYARIAQMCDLARVVGRSQLLIWILQHPGCMVKGSASQPGLHTYPCSCGSPHCAGGLVAHGIPPAIAA